MLRIKLLLLLQRSNYSNDVLSEYTGLFVQRTLAIMQRQIDVRSVLTLEMRNQYLSTCMSCCNRARFCAVRNRKAGFDSEVNLTVGADLMNKR